MAAGTVDVVNPRSGDVIERLPAGDPHAAVDAAVKARDAWARTPAAERAAVVKDVARRLRAGADELARLQCEENGKPLDDSKGGIDAGIGALEQYAELATVHRGRSLNGGWDALDVMVHEPLGVVAAIVPWNDPFAIACQAVGAALCAGNTVVLKPSEKTPLSALALARTFDAAGLPPGVLHALVGTGAHGWALVEHPGVDAVYHVGSVATGRKIAESCGRQLKKCVVELGGKDPMLIDEGVDPAWAAEQAAIGAFANAGQICVSVERIYVHEAIATEFVDALVARANAMCDELGPLIDQELRARVHDHVTSAVANGATLRTGGTIPGGRGFFYPPTVLTDVTDDMTVMTDETFGPVAPVRTVASWDEALHAADATDYGLASVVLTASQQHAQDAWRELKAGTVKVNAAFGGAPGGAATPSKRSGLGFGYGPELLDELTRTKVVHYRPAPGPAAASRGGR
jgi:acyl-CoA reductase-like NAD-dependent aldehyde dehydrogenase